MNDREPGKAGSALPNQFDPASFEERWYRHWEESGAFRAGLRPGAPAFTLMMPPPNVTGYLHMGHALVTTLQDIVTRRKRMQGFDALWLPGTDHAGIATQAVVERELARQGLDRRSLGRDAFVEKVWKWKQEKGGRITFQLRRLGASCDWSRERFTLDEGLSRAVREVFVRLYEEGLIHRGAYLVNWCPGCVTAISDLEVEYEERDGHLWSIRYPRADGKGHVTVATTRPETMLGDTAVAVHPGDERWRDLVGKELELPLTGRRITVIADEMVDPAFGSGAVKVTPAHDPNDWACGQRHGLPVVKVLDERGRITAEGGAYQGLDRDEARVRVLADLKAAGLLEVEKSHRHAVGHCQRCGTVAEPLVSTQWFVRTRPLADAAAQAVRDGRTRFVPERWSRTYFQWMDNIHDWCISRQLWWGHRIPAFHCAGCGKVHVSREDLTACPGCGNPLTQDPDVLDTWFSSALWPFSTLGWPDSTAELKRHYPGTVLITGFDIIFFWVARMMMSGLHHMGDVPFRAVFIHGLIRDKDGRKMSKTLGNVIDPLDLIQEYGTDALRFTLAIMCVPGTDIPLDPKRMEGYRAFCTKVWNATRFALMHTADRTAAPELPDAVAMDEASRWIVARFDATRTQVDEAMEGYRFYEAADALYHFVWGDFCDWYLEASKTALQGHQGPEAQEAARRVLAWVLTRVLALLHPFMPFITEELWHALPWTSGDLIGAAWPSPSGLPADPALLDRFAGLQELTQRIRNLRAQTGAKPGARLRASLWTGTGQAPAIPAWVLRLAGLSELTVAETEDALLAGPREATRLGTLSLETGAADPAERERLVKELGRVEAERAKVAAKLENPAFTGRAPAEVVEKQRAILAELEERMGRLRGLLAIQPSK